jgi:hypothetical protein
LAIHCFAPGVDVQQEQENSQPFCNFLLDTLVEHLHPFETIAWATCRALSRSS